MFFIFLGTVFYTITFFVLSGIRIIRPTQRGIVETLGKYSHFAHPGFNWVFPVLQRMILVDITERMVESGKREMITNDNLNVVIDSIIFYKIKDEEQAIKNSQYNIANYETQIVALAKTTLRNIIGGVSLKEANSERNKINLELLGQLATETKAWGIDIVRAELKEIDPPKAVQEAMNEVVMALNAKTAAVDFATAEETKADGAKRAAIKSAEGKAQSMVLQAEAVKKSAVLEAEGKAEALEKIGEATKVHFTANAQILRTLEAVEKSFQSNTKIIVPQGSQLSNFIGDFVGLDKCNKD